jgi:small-conductance mechanosensitive channel
MAEFLDAVRGWFMTAWQTAVDAVGSPLFYRQLAAALGAALFALLLASVLKRRIALFREAPDTAASKPMRALLFQARPLILPILGILCLGVAVEYSDVRFGASWLVRIAQGLFVIGLLYTLIARLVRNRAAKSLLAWVGIPLASLYIFGWLDDITRYLDAVELNLGNFNASLLALLRTLIFGALLFWLGALSNSAGKNVIRTRQTWNPGTRELIAKLFEITVYFVIFLLLLEIMGINLTTLAVFGGALGIGLGFGLQQIASNFISGIIILLDRSITPGDYVELEDGRSGWLRELNMRYGILETYDGKDIMVPNEQFITSSYTNWTHKDKRQRYALHFQVAYSTDLDLLFEEIRKICRNHPKVLSDPELPIEFQPDAEIEGFGESGIDILVEFWMNGIDDGENRVGADLMHSIWRMIREQGMQIPFPQREIRILGGSPDVESTPKS